MHKKAHKGPGAYEKSVELIIGAKRGNPGESKQECPSTNWQRKRRQRGGNCKGDNNGPRRGGGCHAFDRAREKVG